jgi:uncharacterized cupin superfamily protein
MKNLYEFQRDIISAASRKYQARYPGANPREAKAIFEILGEAIAEAMAVHANYASTEYVEALCTAKKVDILKVLEDRLGHIIEAMQLLGNQVEEHNKALQAPRKPEKTGLWNCYCGTVNPSGQGCTTCKGREHYKS